tara:strand:+ start:266 stop:553 length:288 start_codon:yes stop_codon:yes gene_type:complete
MSSDDTIFTRENMNLLANEGFKYLRNKLSKPLITPGDAFIEFLEFNNKDNDDDNDMLYTQLFCLVLQLVYNLNDLPSETNDKIINGLIKRYSEKI